METVKDYLTPLLYWKDEGVRSDMVNYISAEEDETYQKPNVVENVEIKLQ